MSGPLTASNSYAALNLLALISLIPVSYENRSCEKAEQASVREETL